MKTVKIHNDFITMCAGLINAGVGFTFTSPVHSIVPFNNHISHRFKEAMGEFFGLTIDLDEHDMYDGFTFSPYMYTEIKPKHKLFDSFFEIPSHAVFRAKNDHNRIRKVTEQKHIAGVLHFVIGPNAITPLMLLEQYDMTLDNGKTWSTADMLA